MKLGVLVYLEHENKVLMIHRQKEDEHKGYWLAPGGKIEKNEAPHETAVREYQEETGLTPEGLQIKAVLSFPDLGDSPFGDEWQVFLFHADRFKGELTDHCPEGQLQWVARDKLQELPMWEGDLLFPQGFSDLVFLAAKCCIGEIVWNKAFFGNDSKLQDSYLKRI